MARPALLMAGIRVRGVVKVYGNAPSGAFVCLLGPSGCGKTTLLNILSGLEPGSGAG